ncbi:MAG: hypothetical protein ACLFVS_07245 [Candidatus Acetothermia bacterium]
MAESARSTDTVVRYGSDEFLVMTPETEKLPEDFRSRLLETLDEWDEGRSLIDFPLSVSLRYSQWDPNQSRDVE